MISKKEHDAAVKAVGPYTKRRNELQKQYRWKAANIVRFFDHLGMTKEQKVEFLAQELAGVHQTVELHHEGVRMIVSHGNFV